MNLRVSEILQLKSLNAYFKGNEQILEHLIAGVSTDSRTIKPGELFFAIRGEKFDAHQFVPEVQAKQALAVVVDQQWYESCQLLGNFIVVQDALIALQEAGHYYRSKFNIPMIAITGSNGKTTVKEMVAAVLSQSYQVFKNKGNLNNHIGVPLTLFEISNASEVMVLEIGANHFGEVKRLSEIAQPTYGLITNVGPVHLEFFGSLEGVARAKTELWKFLESKKGTAFVNVDDIFLAKMIPHVKKVITYGFENKADIHGQYLGSDDNGKPKFKVNDTEIRLQVAGMHNIYNALAAVSVGLEFNLTMNQIKSALTDFLPTAKRMEIIRKKGITIINDCYNSNLLAAEKALITLSQMKTTSQRVAVLGDMLELGQFAEEHHRKLGEIVAKLKINYLLAFGPLSVFTIDQAKKSGLEASVHFKDKDELINYLNKLVQQNDIILIKGSRGMAMENVTEGILT